ncbi:hypothetical protein BV898_08267 [Hypsibius exemplaris]|uniref:Uncharacterized protein n=1 Tax=Hypsibius exemplaris TaxID=2072580 RepID=A0A1W0WR62_HYPEX|nr:hypothetical protein BV898_08267 [Hypsibius exemplaris]
MTEYDAASKSGENIREFVEEHLEDPYVLSELICQNALFVTEGAANMIKAFNIQMNSEKENKLPMTCFTCICHRIRQYQPR